MKAGMCMLNITCDTRYVISVMIVYAEVGKPFNESEISNTHHLGCSQVSSQVIESSLLSL